MIIWILLFLLWAIAGLAFCVLTIPSWAGRSHALTGLLLLISGPVIWAAVISALTHIILTKVKVRRNSQ